MIKLVTFSELINALTKDNNLFGAITFLSKGWNPKEGGYSLAESTFIFSGTNKYFGDYCGRSCYASDIAKIDTCIRLDAYWDKWEKLACFIMDKDSVSQFEAKVKELQEAGMSV